MKYALLAVFASVTLACGGTYLATATPTSTQAVAPVVTQFVPSTPAPSETHAPQPTVSPVPNATAEVVKTSINIRLQPNGERVGMLKAGDTVEILSCKDGWCEVKLYVWQGCLSENPEGLGCQSK